MKASETWAAAYDEALVFPCNADKSPRTPNGFHDAKPVKAWGDTDAPLWGLDPSSIDAVVGDVDRKHGKDGWAELGKLLGEELRDRLFKTAKCVTPSGGEHFYFLTAEKFGNAKLCTGVDIRSAKGYVCLYGPLEGEPVDLPAELRSRMLTVDEKPEPAVARPMTVTSVDELTALRWGLDYVEGLKPAEAGGRNNALYGVAKDLHHYAGLSRSGVETLTRAVAAKCVPPYPEGKDEDKELAATIASATSEAPLNVLDFGERWRALREAKRQPAQAANDDAQEDDENPFAGCEWFGDDFVNLPTAPKAMLVPPFIPSGSRVLIFGDTGSGKTLWVVDLIRQAIASGAHALYVSSDESRRGLQGRLRQAGCGAREVSVLHNSGFVLEDKKLCAALAAKMEREGTNLLVLDVFSDVTALDMDNNRDVTGLLKIVRQLQSVRPEDDPLTVVLLYHTGNNETGRPRGAASLRQQILVSYEVALLDTDEKSFLDAKITVRKTKDLDEIESREWKMRVRFTGTKNAPGTRVDVTVKPLDTAQASVGRVNAKAIKVFNYLGENVGAKMLHLRRDVKGKKEELGRILDVLQRHGLIGLAPKSGKGDGWMVTAGAKLDAATLAEVVQDVIRLDKTASARREEPGALVDITARPKRRAS